jgi:hypothetical protein
LHPATNEELYLLQRHSGFFQRNCEAGHLGAEKDGSLPEAFFAVSPRLAPSLRRGLGRNHEPLASTTSPTVSATFFSNRLGGVVLSRPEA